MDNQALIANRYRIKSKLGQGGMGTVYLATDTQTSASVAVKQLTSSFAEADLIERFKREGEALRDLNHPNIVKLLEMLEDNGEHYLVMEYVKGGDLSDLLKQGDIDLELILKYALDLADALTRAHKLNIIHRDLKPANILVTTNGTLRLTDFGVARLGSKDRVTDTDAIIGTIDYLPPEAFDGKGIDTRADIWAFGVILFEMVTGKRPFSAENIVETIHQITTQPIPDIEELNPNVPVDLIDLVYRMLERDPQSRITSVRRVGTELEDILYGRTSKQVDIKRFNTPTPSPNTRHLHNLPAQTTPFVGRSNEIQAIKDLLLNVDNRLVTILAPGGMGKTRLSLAAAEACFDAYPDGIHFVELAPLSDTDSIITTIGDELGYIFQTDGRELVQQVIDFLHNKTALLILDNYEHLTEGAYLTSDLLKGAPNLNILVTSRQRLSQMGETLYHLSGMDFPKWKTTEDALTYGSVQLFLQSAKRIQPEFELTDDNLNDVAQICKLVQGMPLGILLSASWLGMLSPSEVAEEIAGGIDFFETDEIGLPDRQRSIRVVFDYSWASITHSEQDVFMRLSVFRGGFTREAAQAVANANLRVLMSLLNKSLIRRNSETGRYEVHELLRQYGAEKLTTSPEAVAIAQNAHGLYYMKLIASNSEHLNGSNQLKVINEFSTESENLRVAWGWAIKNNQLQLILGAGNSYSIYHNYHNHYNAGRNEMYRAIQHVEQQAEDALQGTALAELLAGHAWLSIRLGQFDLAYSHFERCIELRAKYNASSYGFTTDGLSGLSLISGMRGHHDEAIRLGLQSYEGNIARSDRVNPIMTCYVLVSTYFAQGLYQEALQYAEEAKSHAEHAGNDWFLALILNDLGRINRVLNNYDQAKIYHTTAYDIGVRFGDYGGMANALNHLATIAYHQTDFDQAHEHYKRCREIYEQNGDSAGLTFALLGLGRIASHQEDDNNAEDYLRLALRASMTTNLIPLQLSVITAMSRLLLKKNILDLCYRVLSMAINHPSIESENQDEARVLLAQCTERLDKDSTVTIEPDIELSLDIAIEKLLLPFADHA
jgi:serine/threonine protein kinase/tetratricopeptide (TPR) repeat protein